MWETPKEAALRIELKRAQAEISRLKYELGSVRMMDLEQTSELMEIPEIGGDTVTLTKHDSIAATRNHYGALHVTARGKMSGGNLVHEYYVAGAGWKDSDSIEILGRSHADFVQRLAKEIIDRKL